MDRRTQSRTSSSHSEPSSTAPSPPLAEPPLAPVTGRKRRLSAAENAAEMVGKRHAKGTKSLYAGRQRRFKEWIKNHESPEISGLYVDGDVQVPVPDDVIMEFFGYVGSQGEVEIGNERDNDAMEVKSNHEDSLQRLPPAVVNAVLQKIRVEGAVAVTNDDLEKYFSENRAALGNEIRELIDSRLTAIGASTPTTVPDSPTAVEGPANVNFTPFQWGGGFHYLPEDYCFSPMTVKNVWNRWLYGVPRDGIPPYRFIVKNTKSISSSKERVKFSKIKYVAEKLLSVCSVSVTDIVSLSVSEVNNLFIDAFKHYLHDYDRHRYAELSYITVYNRMRAAV